MLEVGLLGGASLKMWSELFPNMHIYGVDLKAGVSSDRHTIIQADQSSQSDLDRVVRSINHPLYFINDDGSHIPEHQLLTFNTMFPKLEVGGVYIIEDIETSYWVRHQIYGYPTRYGVGHPKSIVEIFKMALDGVNYEFSNVRRGPVKHQEYIKGISFYRNCIIITKKSPNDRPYRISKATARYTGPKNG